MNAIHDEQFIVSALSQGKLHLKAYLASIEAERYAENLRAEVKYDMEPRYEQVIVINVRTGAITGDGFMVFDERAARRALDLVLVEVGRSVVKKTLFIVGVVFIFALVMLKTGKPL